MILTVRTVAILAVSLGYAITPLLAQQSTSQPTSDPAAGLTLKTPTYEGCFSSSDPLQDQGPYTYQALGWCQPLCVRMGKPVLAFSNGTNCWCGDELPAASDKVSDSECGVPCNGFPNDQCGGSSAYGVYLTGVESSVANYDQGSSGSSSSAVSVPQTTPVPTSTSVASNGSPTVIRVASTVFITAPNETSSQVVYTTQVVKAGGSNKAAIAAGVVVGVVIIFALVGGVLFFLRHRSRQRMQDEQQRTTSLSNIVTSNEKPASTVSLSDSRLEPSVMFSRRQSDGSIADNQDYSRRILKVTNPDGT